MCVGDYGNCEVHNWPVCVLCWAPPRHLILFHKNFKLESDCVWSKIKCNHLHGLIFFILLSMYWYVRVQFKIVEKEYTYMRLKLTMFFSQTLRDILTVSWVHHHHHLPPSPPSPSYSYRSKTYKATTTEDERQRRRRRRWWCVDEPSQCSPRVPVSISHHCYQYSSGS